MRPRHPLIVLPLLILSACGGASKAAPKPEPPPPAGPSAPAPTAATREGPMQFKTSKTVSPEVQARFCNAPPGPGPTRVQVLKDSAGNIGGYVHQIVIRDAPMHYLDCEGKPLAMFHIFGPEDEKKRNTPIIDALKQAFPVEEALPCPDPGKKPEP